MIVLLSTTADNAAPLIVIDGSQITNIAQRLGLQLQADGRSAQGLVISPSAAPQCLPPTWVAPGIRLAGGMAQRSQL